jgi:hypothetical protein
LPARQKCYAMKKLAGKALQSTILRLLRIVGPMTMKEHAHVEYFAITIRAATDVLIVWRVPGDLRENHYSE